MKNEELLFLSRNQLINSWFLSYWVSKYKYNPIEKARHSVEKRLSKIEGAYLTSIAVTIVSLIFFLAGLSLVGSFLKEIFSISVSLSGIFACFACMGFGIFLILSDSTRLRLEESEFGTLLEKFQGMTNLNHGELARMRTEKLVELAYNILQRSVGHLRKLEDEGRSLDKEADSARNEFNQKYDILAQLGLISQEKTVFLTRVDHVCLERDKSLTA